MSRIGIILAEGFEEIEGLTVVDILRRAGVDVVTISITGGKQVTGSHAITVLADVLYEEVDINELDGIVLPGGMPGTRNLIAHSGLEAAICSFAEAKKLVAAICAAPSVLGHAGILKGRRATCYPGFEDQLYGALVAEEQVVKDETIITSRGMGTAIPFALALVSYCKGQAKADEIAESIIYRQEAV